MEANCIAYVLLDSSFQKVLGSTNVYFLAVFAFYLVNYVGFIAILTAHVFTIIYKIWFGTVAFPIFQITGYKVIYHYFI